MSFNRRILNLMSTKEAAQWMLSPNKELEGLSPEVAIRNGEFLRVNNLLEKMEKNKKEKLQ